MIKVRMSNLSTKGLEIIGRLRAESLNARMNEGEENQISFLKDIDITLEAKAKPYGAELQGKVKAPYTQPCPRCLDPKERELSVDLSLILRQPERNESAEESQAKCQSDEIILYVDTDWVELDGVLEENLILALDPFCVFDFPCRCEPHAAEPVKKNVQSLGALLAEAGVR